MANILHVTVPNGNPGLVWPARSDPTVNSLLFINQDLNNTVYLGQTSTVAANGPNSIPIPPNGTFSGDSASAWYVVGAIAGIQPLVVVPNGQAYFLGITQGLGKLVIPQVQSPNFVTGVSGWIIRKDGSAEFNNLVIRGSTLIGSVELQYSTPTPQLNTLIYSASATEFQDSAGNWILAGTTTYGPDAFTGVGYVAVNTSQGEINFWHTTGTTMGGVTPPWQAEDIISYTGSIAGLLIQDASGFGIQIQAINNGAVTLVGSPTGETASGFTGKFPIEQVDATDNTNANNGTVGLTTLYTIPANDAKVNTQYIIEVPFNGIFQTAQLGFKPALDGPSVATSIGDVLANGAIAAGTGFTGTVRLRVMVTQTGAGGLVDYFIDGGVAVNAAHTSTGSVYLSSQSTGMPFDTTSSHTLRINSVWGAAVAAQTVTGHGSVFTRKGP